MGVRATWRAHDHVCRALANGASCVVVSVDSGSGRARSFQRRFTTASRPRHGSREHAEELGVDRGRIAVGGDTPEAIWPQWCRRWRRPGRAEDRVSVARLSRTRYADGFPSIEENADGPLLTKAAMNWFINHYLGGEGDRSDPLASPLLASDLRGLPPAFILTAECDPLRDEGNAYGKRLRTAGVAAKVRCYEGMPHGFFSFAAALDGGRKAVADSIGQLRAAFGLEELGRSADSGA